MLTTQIPSWGCCWRCKQGSSCQVCWFRRLQWGWGRRWELKHAMLCIHQNAWKYGPVQITVPLIVQRSCLSRTGTHALYTRGRLNTAFLNDHMFLAIWLDQDDNQRSHHLIQLSEDVRSLASKLLRWNNYWKGIMLLYQFRLLVSQPWILMTGQKESPHLGQIFSLSFCFVWVTKQNLNCVWTLRECSFLHFETHMLNQNSPPYFIRLDGMHTFLHLMNICFVSGISILRWRINFHDILDTAEIMLTLRHAIQNKYSLFV